VDEKSVIPQNCELKGPVNAGLLFYERPVCISLDYSNILGPAAIVKFFIKNHGSLDAQISLGYKFVAILPTTVNYGEHYEIFFDFTGCYFVTFCRVC